MHDGLFKKKENEQLTMFRRGDVFANIILQNGKRQEVVIFSLTNIN